MLELQYVYYKKSVKYMNVVLCRKQIDLNYNQ